MRGHLEPDGRRFDFRVVKPGINELALTFSPASVSAGESRVFKSRVENERAPDRERARQIDPYRVLPRIRVAVDRKFKAYAVIALFFFEPDKSKTRRHAQFQAVDASIVSCDTKRAMDGPFVLVHSDPMHRPNAKASVVVGDGHPEAGRSIGECKVRARVGGQEPASPGAEEMRLVLRDGFETVRYDLRETIHRILLESQKPVIPQRSVGARWFEREVESAAVRSGDR